MTSLEIVSLVISVIAAIICGYIIWCYEMEKPAYFEGSRVSSALFAAIIAAFIGFFFWFFALVIYWGTKLLMIVCCFLMEVINFVYDIYIIPLFKKNTKKRKLRRVRKHTCRQMKKNIGLL